MQLLKILSLSMVILLGLTPSLFAAMATNTQSPPTARQERQWERAQLEVIAGRPLRLGERIALNLTRPLRKQMAAPTLEGTAVSSCTLGVLGTLLMVIGASAGAANLALMGLLFCGVAPILGFIGLRRIKRSQGKLQGKALAILGIVIGLLTLGAVTAFLISFGQGW